MQRQIFYIQKAPTQISRTFGGLIINYILDRKSSVDANVAVKTPEGFRSLYGFNLSTPIGSIPGDIILGDGGFTNLDDKLVAMDMLVKFIVDSGITDPAVIQLAERLNELIGLTEQEILLMRQKPVTEEVIVQETIYEAPGEQLGFPATLPIGNTSVFEVGHRYGRAAATPQLPQPAQIFQRQPAPLPVSAPVLQAPVLQAPFGQFQRSTPVPVARTVVVEEERVVVPRGAF